MKPEMDCCLCFIVLGTLFHPDTGQSENIGSDFEANYEMLFAKLSDKLTPTQYELRPITEPPKTYWKENALQISDGINDDKHGLHLLTNAGREQLKNSVQWNNEISEKHVGVIVNATNFFLLLILLKLTKIRDQNLLPLEKTPKIPMQMTKTKDEAQPNIAKKKFNTLEYEYECNFLL